MASTIYDDELEPLTQARDEDTPAFEDSDADCALEKNPETKKRSHGSDSDDTGRVAKRVRRRRKSSKRRGDQLPKQIRNFCFTLNNPEPDAAARRCTLLRVLPAKYVVIGIEGASDAKTTHLQGYVELEKRLTFSKLKKLIPRAHFESRRGTASQAADYCKKEGNWKELGTISCPGKRSDIQRIRDLVSEGKTRFEIMQQVDAAFRYVNAVDRYISDYQHSCRQPIQLTLRPWQATLVTLLTSTAPHPRQVLWYWESKGNTGKSTLATYLAFNHNAFLTTGGKYADIALAYNNQSIVVFDFTRDIQERIPYPVIEGFKNGTLFSGKYQSHMRFFPKPHVVIFANFEPDRTKLSADRWNINKILTL